MMVSNRAVYLFDVIGAVLCIENEVGEMRRVLNSFLQLQYKKYQKV